MAEGPMSTPRRPDPRSSAAPMTASFRSRTEWKARSTGDSQGAFDRDFRVCRPAPVLGRFALLEGAFELRRRPIAGHRSSLCDLEVDLDIGRRARATAGAEEKPAIGSVVAAMGLLQHGVELFQSDSRPDHVAGSVPALGLELRAERRRVVARIAVVADVLR